ncbi:ribbon-helix-helix protein, CopG family [Candidatus Kaiserbacteria bacterium]|nr:ribbon-helix-helix protein, CopG family [Candidatus Kaiserbacteria bacterium]
MANLSVSIDGETAQRLEAEIAQGDFQSKSELVKRAITEYMRELAYQRILQSRREYMEGKYFLIKGPAKDHFRKMRI